MTTATNKGQYQKRRAKNLCGACGKNDSGDHSYCEDCRAAEKQRRDERSAKRTGLGLCVTCGTNAPKPEGKMCQGCIDKVAGSAYEGYLRKKSEGLCRKCKEKAINKSYCAKHAEEIREYTKERYKKRVSSGLCVYCHNATNNNGLSSCDDCRAKNSERLKERKEEAKTGAYGAYGGYKCSKCDIVDHTLIEIVDLSNPLKSLNQARLCNKLKKQGYPDGFAVLCRNCRTKVTVKV